jgi:phage-related holin
MEATKLVIHFYIINGGNTILCNSKCLPVRTAVQSLRDHLIVLHYFFVNYSLTLPSFSSDSPSNPMSFEKLVSEQMNFRLIIISTWINNYFLGHRYNTSGVIIYGIVVQLFFTFKTSKGLITTVSML